MTAMTHPHSGTGPATAVAIEAPRPGKPRDTRLRGRGPSVHTDGRSPEARKLGAAILEVLAGARTPTEAAQALGVSLPRYYALEIRALDGLLLACEPRTKGRRRTPEREGERLRREIQRLQRECARTQTLLRVAQRSVGLAPPPKPPAKPEPGRRRKKRRGTARALKAAVALQAEPAGKALEKGGATGQDGEPKMN